MNTSANYRMLFDFHTHTTFSHGKGSIEDNVREGVKKGLKAIAITDHGPGHLTYGIKRSAVAEMRAEIERLKPLYPEIEIYLGVEANIINSENNLDVTKEEFSQYDFVNAGYHYGVTNAYCLSNFIFAHSPKQSKKKRKKLAKRNTLMVIKALKENKIKILTHPGDKAPFDMELLAAACEELGVLMEISTHHSHMTVEEIKIAMKYPGVKFIVSSDAHIVDKIGDFQEAVDRAIEAGLDIDRIVNIEKI